MGVFGGTHRGLWVACCPSKQILLRHSVLQGSVECEVSVWIIGLQWKTTLLAMDIALDVELIYLGNAEQEVSRAWEVFGVRATNAGMVRKE